MERLVDLELAWETEVLGGELSNCHVVHNQTHITENRMSCHGYCRQVSFPDSYSLGFALKTGSRDRKISLMRFVLLLTSSGGPGSITGTTRKKKK
jgi:hypothetical protein